MPLNGMAVKQNATALTPTGGTDVTFTGDGVTIANGLHLADASQTDFRIRRSVTVKNRPPVLQANGTYTKDKKTVTFTQPKILASGMTVFNIIRVEREVHPESTAAEALELNMLMGQLLSDSDAATFWSAGSLS